MGRHGNRSGQCFSACSFRRPLTTSSASILNPSWNISPKHSFKTQDIISCRDLQRKKSLIGAPGTRTMILWSSFSHRFLGVENGQPFTEPMMVLSYLLPLSWRTSSQTPTRRHLDYNFPLACRPTIPKPFTLSYTRPVFSYTRWPFSRLPVAEQIVVMLLSSRFTCCMLISRFKNKNKKSLCAIHAHYPRPTGSV